MKKNFSRSSFNYDEFANVQKHMIKELIKGFEPNDKIIKILEIGAGTGLLTKELIRLFPKSQITILDISEQMIEKCKKKFGNRIDYLIADAENIEFGNTFDLIISNATFQWFNNLEKTIGQLKNYLNPQGEIIFSTFMEGTYKELKSSLLKVSETYNYSQKFVEIKTLENIQKLKSIKTEVYTEKYNDLLEFLRAIKGIGAQSSLENKKNLTYQKLREVEKNYLNDYGRIVVSNYLAYVKIGK